MRQGIVRSLIPAAVVACSPLAYGQAAVANGAGPAISKFRPRSTVTAGAPASSSESPLSYDRLSSSVANKSR